MNPAVSGSRIPARSKFALAMAVLVLVSLFPPTASAGVSASGAELGNRNGSGNNTSQECGDATDTYETIEPAAVGLDAAKVQQAIDYWVQRGSDTVKVFRHNCLVGEGALHEEFNNRPHVNHSHTKTILALVVGRAQRQGFLKLNDPIGDYLPVGLGDEEHRAVTVRQLLTMTGGARMNWSREIGGGWSAQPDRVREWLSLPIEHDPGTWFEYAQTPLYVLTHVVELAVGRDFQEYAHEELLSRLGIPRHHWYWGRDRAGHTDGPGWFRYSHPEDFGRIGQFLLNEGTWHGERLVNRRFLQELRTGTDANPGYGFLVWLNGKDQLVNASIWGRQVLEGPIIPSAPTDMYMSWGYVGQHVFVIPSLDMVVTRTGYVTPDQVHALDDPGNALIMGRQKRGYYDFFKILMAGVTDVDMPEPPPYDEMDWTFDFDPGAWLTPRDNLAAVVIGDGAAEDCTALGCDGEVALEGWGMTVEDVLRAMTGEDVSGTISGADDAQVPDVTSGLTPN